MKAIPTSPALQKGFALVQTPPEPTPPAAPLPLTCRLANLLVEWKGQRDKFHAEDNTEAEIATSVCMQRLHETVRGFFDEVKVWQEGMERGIGK